MKMMGQPRAACSCRVWSQQQLKAKLVIFIPAEKRTFRGKKPPAEERDRQTDRQTQREKKKGEDKKIKSPGAVQRWRRRASERRRKKKKTSLGEESNESRSREPGRRRSEGQAKRQRRQRDEGAKGTEGSREKKPEVACYRIHHR